jgi:NADH dehydrogenase [ubiquinone] 1 alpha subcomplex assembly factor 6
VKDVARGNALPAQMRMQWWREVVAAIYANPTAARLPPHPVARALADAVAAHGLTRRWLDRVLEARARDLDNVQPQTLGELEEYAEYTASSLLYLTLESLGIRHPTADHAASHAGKAVGIATLLRGTRYHASQQAVYVPVELQRAFKVNVNDILRGPSSPEAAHALADVFYEVASQAHVHLEHARTLLSAAPSSHACGDGEGQGQQAQAREPAPPGTVTALLPAVRAGMFLEALQEAGFDALNDQLLPPKAYFGYQCRLLWANVRGKI